MILPRYPQRFHCVGSITLVCGALLGNCVKAQALQPNATASERPATVHSCAVAQQNGINGHTSLQMISPQAQAHIDYALNLAERGAVQSAQAEFIMALDLVADAVDADSNDTSRRHARAIQAGLTAIAETKDFVPADTPHNVVLNLSQLAATHKSPVLKNVDVSKMSRAGALQSYHTYATEQLAFGGGHSAIASAALYGLGRSQCVTTAGATTRNPLGAPNAMALYQAALLVDPHNYMASNELGVLMARYGDFQSAADQLGHSLSIKPQAETWHNLAVVYQRLGQPEKAKVAEQEREKLLAATDINSETAKDPTDLAARPAIRLIDNDSFAATATPQGVDGAPLKPSSPTASVEKESFVKRWVAKLNPWSKSEKTPLNADSLSNENAGQTRIASAAGQSLYK